MQFRNATRRSRNPPEHRGGGMAPQNVVRHGDESFQPWLRWCVVFHCRGRVAQHSSHRCQCSILPRSIESLDPRIRQIWGCTPATPTGTAGGGGWRYGLPKADPRAMDLLWDDSMGTRSLEDDAEARAPPTWCARCRVSKRGHRERPTSCSLICLAVGCGKFLVDLSATLIDDIY